MSATEQAPATAVPPASGGQIDRDTIREPGSGISHRLALVFAVACGATVANLYYAQPLLSPIAHAFHVSDGTAGLLVTITQITYAIGLFLIVPLGDLVDRRRLMIPLLCVCALALAVAAAAPSYAVLAVGLAVASIATVVVQILVPLASTLAEPEARGRIVGTVMSGLLTGILLARTVSGLIAGIAGWRAPFWVAAVMMVVLVVVLWRVMPRVRPSTDLSYPRLLGSVLRIISTEARLRRRMVYSSFGMMSFSLIWTTIAFLLANGRYHYGSITIGLFGLAGLFGAVGAAPVGRLSDRSLGRAVSGLGMAMVLISWGILSFAPHSLIALVIGLVMIDFAVQGVNITSQHVIYGIGSGQESRITTAWVMSNFIGAAIGSAIGSLVWDQGGWGPVCIAGAVFAAIPLLFWLSEPGMLGRLSPLRRVGRA